MDEKFSRRKPGYILLSPRETPRMFFPLHTRVAPPVYVPTTSFKLMALWNITVEESLLSKSASITMNQTSHPVYSKKKKKEKT